MSMLAMKEVAWEGGSSWKALVDYGIAEQLCLAAINLEMKFPENLDTTEQQRLAARETVRLSVHSSGFDNCRSITVSPRWNRLIISLWRFSIWVLITWRVPFRREIKNLFSV